MKPAEKLDKYGLTPAQREKMWQRQKGLCALCGRPLWKKGNKEGKRASPVDHDHSKTGKSAGRVRGYLCYRCNRFRVSRNTAESARKLYEYLVSEFDGRKL